MNTQNEFRPERLMEKALEFIGHHNGCTRRQIEEGLAGRGTLIRLAVRLLIEEGYVEATPGPRGSAFHSSLVEYREREPEETKPCYVYRYYDAANVLLYVDR